MASSLAILTYKRRPVLQAFLESLATSKIIGNHPVAVFEDCGNWDDTVSWLTDGAEARGTDQELNSDVFMRPDGVLVFIGRRREGVAGQSNKALKWFERSDLDHLCLCNDDLLASGDFVAEYAEAHKHLEIDFLTYSGFTSEMHKCATTKYRGRDVRLIIRMVGAMISLTKRVVKTIGYMDMRFGLFGQEHCEINNRARRCGFINMHGQPQTGVDIVSKFLSHQEVESSIRVFERPLLDAEAAAAISQIGAEAFNTAPYTPFRLRHPRLAFGYAGLGTPVKNLERVGYTLVNDLSSVSVEL